MKRRIEFVPLLSAIEAGRVGWTPAGRSTSYFIGPRSLLGLPRDIITTDVKPVVAAGLATLYRESYIGRGVDLTDEGKALLALIREVPEEAELDASGYVRTKNGSRVHIRYVTREEIGLT